VLEGQAHYLLQSRDLRDIVMISASPGEVVIIPPGYGHVSINPSPDETLVMANIVSTAFESEYGEYEAHHGAAYFELCSGELRKNPRYPDVAPVRSVRPKSGHEDHRILRGPLYSLIGNAKALAFLNEPENYTAIMDILLKG
jgi:glucose-6-phosphate isomerase, archaeal